MVQVNGENLGVGEAGFEPAASCSQSRHAAKLRHSPVENVILA